MSLGPFDLAGGPFLNLYLLLFAAAIVAGIVIPRLMRPAGRRQRVTDVNQLAFLSGGRPRFSEAVVARLLAARALVMTGRDRFEAASDAAATTPAEAGVLALRAPIRWRDIGRALHSHAEPLERRLVAAGLLIDKAERATLRFWATLPYALLIAFGATKLMVGEARDRPTGYLTVLLILTTVVAFVRWITVDRRTEAGRDALAGAMHDAGRLRIAPTSPEVGLAVALFGTTVLAASDLADFHRLRSAGDGASAGSSDSSSGGGSDSGGGGGGCGGCGGGGCGG